MAVIKNNACAPSDWICNCSGPDDGSAVLLWTANWPTGVSIRIRPWPSVPATRTSSLAPISSASSAGGGCCTTTLGAGGGGFLMFYCQAEHRWNLRERMAQEGLREMHFRFDMEGVKVLMNV